MQLQDAAFARPCRRHRAGESDDFGSVSRETLTLEGGLGKAALTQVQRLLAGKQAVAEDAAGTAKNHTAEVVLGVVDEQFVDKIGVAKLKLAEAARSQEAGDIAEAGGDLLIKGRGVYSEEGAIEDPACQRWAIGPFGASRILQYCCPLCM